MKFRIALLIGSISLIGASKPASAQKIIQGPGGITIQIDGNDPNMAAAMAAAQAQAEAEAEAQQASGGGDESGNSAGGAPKKTPEAERKELFMKLSFDRRPSSILKAWASPEKTEEDYQKEDAEELKKEEEAEAKKKATADEVKQKVEEAKKAAEVKEESTEPETPPTDAQLAAKAKAEEAKAKAEEQKKEAAEKAKAAAAAVKAQTKAITRELEKFQRAVTLSDWDTVTKYFTEKFEKEDDQKAAYKFFLGAVSTTPADQPQPPQPGKPRAPRRQQGNPAYTEKNVFLPGDILGIADASPVELDEEHAQTLGRLLANVKQQGSFIEELVAAMEKGTARLGGADPVRKFAAARMLIAASSAADAGPFLPDPEEAATSENVEALQLLGLYYLALREKEEKMKENLVKAWNVNQKILDIKDLDEEDKDAALITAVELAPQVSEELGDKWMVDSFTSNPQRGMEVIASIGSIAAETRGNMSAQQRLQALKLQSTAAESLLKNAAERADQWKTSLGILAMNWLHEAEYSRQYDNSDSMQAQMQWDEYGNMYWAQDPYQRHQQQNNNNMPQAIKTGDLLEIAPGQTWLKEISSALQPKFSMVLAQLYLKVHEDESAFPYIEALSRTQPKTAHDLANEFIRVWTRNHDPNNEKRRTSSYMYFYGFSQRADSIPLTRSKQQRNLEDLAKWVTKLHELPIEPLDEEVVATAFVTTHSQAEVYRIDDIQKVFGAMDKLKPETLAQLLQTMRANLASVWRSPKVQQAAQTNRKDVDIQAEVLRGYEVALSVVNSGVTAHPNSWQLQLAKAAILFDWNNYEKEQTPSTEFTDKRDNAFNEFASAATKYAAALPTIGENKETADVYLTWFYASLGACDLGALKHDQISSPVEQEKIKAAIAALPGAVADRHLSKFANSLASRISSVGAELKQRYLKAGLAISGDHKETREAKKLYTYYSDLVSEIKLVSTIDGSDRIGDGQPFGMFVDLLHTTHIERESGGFTKYLTNQNNSPYAWNYGRPAENYRDKFEEAAREALKENFDILSVTFHSEKIKSRGIAQEGWRVTPYAYVLMKAKGPQVDSIPSLRMDMDFLDTSGFVVLPIESAKLPVDAGQHQARPVKDLAITQTLNEKEAANGKLELEIKATGHGVIPDIDQFLDVKTSDFKVTKVDDKGVSVTQLDAETDENSVITERNWLVEYTAADNLTAPANTFNFPTPKAEVKEVNYQRYEDVDMVAASETISLIREVGKKKLAWWIIPAIAVALLLLIAFIIIAIRVNKQPVKRGIAYRMPKHVTPFTVISLLQRIRDNEKLSKKSRRELESSIENLETHYFATEKPTETPPDSEAAEPAKKPPLKRIARTWIERVTV